MGLPERRFENKESAFNLIELDMDNIYLLTEFITTFYNSLVTNIVATYKKPYIFFPAGLLHCLRHSCLSTPTTNLF